MKNKFTGVNRTRTGQTKRRFWDNAQSFCDICLINPTGAWVRDYTEIPDEVFFELDGHTCANMLGRCVRNRDCCEKPREGHDRQRPSPGGEKLPIA